MLSKKDLQSIGYSFCVSDFDLPYFVTPDDNPSVDYATEAITVAAASLNAVIHHDLSRCDNCGKLHSEETLKEVRHLSMRTEPGGTIPSGECADCGALCYPLKDDEPTELAPINHDTSVMVGVIQAVDWNLLSKQKRALVELASSPTVSLAYGEALAGVIHLLDALQDAASDDGLTVVGSDQDNEEDDEEYASQVERRDIFTEALHAKFLSTSMTEREEIIIRRNLVAQEILDRYPFKTVITRELYDADDDFGECLIWMHPHFEFPAWEGRNLAEFLRTYGTHDDHNMNVIQYRTRQPNKDGVCRDNITLQQLRDASPLGETGWMLPSGLELWFHRSQD